VLAGDEARALLSSIDTSTLIGLRDRALIAAVTYTFARVSAVLGMKVRYYFVKGRRSWVRLHDKDGKEHQVHCHHNLEKYLPGGAGSSSIVLALTASGPPGADRHTRADT
jgi:site-specific recombinase XerD